MATKLKVGKMFVSNKGIFLSKIPSKAERMVPQAIVQSIDSNPEVSMITYQNFIDQAWKKKKSTNKIDFLKKEV